MSLFRAFFVFSPTCSRISRPNLIVHCKLNAKERMETLLQTLFYQVCLHRIPKHTLIKKKVSLQTEHKRKDEDTFVNFILPPTSVCNEYPNMHL